MKLHPIVHTAESRNWCGPAALSAITGIHTSISRDIIKQAIKDELGKTNRRLHGGVAVDEILKALDLYSINHKLLYQSALEPAPSVATTLHHFRPIENNLFLMVIQESKSTYSHYIVTDGTKIIDNFYPNGVIFWECVHMDKRVLRLWELSELQAEDL